MREFMVVLTIILAVFTIWYNKRGQMTDKEFLESRGWEHWYTDDDWWCHPKTVSGPARMDFTNYQYPTADAIEFEKNPKPIPYYGDLGAAIKYIVETERKK